MEDLARGSVLEKYGQSLYALVFGPFGFFIAEVVMHETWPTFAGLLLGLALGTVVSLLLMRRRRAHINSFRQDAD